MRTVSPSRVTDPGRPPRSDRTCTSGPGSPTVWSTPVQDTANRTIAQIGITDPGYAYRIRAYAQAEIGAAPGFPGTRVDSQLSTTASGTAGTNWNVVRGDTTPNFHTHYGLSPNTYTGAQTVYFNAFLVGSGGWTSTNLNYSFGVEIVPA